MNLDEFQKNRLEVYFKAHASAELSAHRKTEKLTINGAYNWIISKIKKTCDTEGGVAIGDDQWCYDEMMHYFSMCKEGDEYHTKEEIEAEEKRQAEEAKKRKADAKAKWDAHRERVSRWATMSRDAILTEVKREKYLKTHPLQRELTDEEIALKQQEERERAEKAKYEAEERARKQAVKAAKKKALEEAEARKKAMEEAQMTLF